MTKKKILLFDQNLSHCTVVIVIKFMEQFFNKVYKLEKSENFDEHE